MPRNAKTMLGWASQPSSPEPPPRAAQRAALPHQPAPQQAGPSLLIRPRSRSRSPAPVKIYPRQTLLEAYPQQGPAQETHPRQAYPQRGASRQPHVPPIYRESPLAGRSAGNPPAARRSYLQLMAICDRAPAPVTAPRGPDVHAGTADDDLDEDLAAIGTGARARWTGPIYLLGALVLFAGLECLLMASGALPPLAATAVSLAASALLLLWPAIRARRQALAPIVEAADQHDTEEMPFPSGAFDPDLDEDSGADPQDGADADLDTSGELDSSAAENAGSGAPQRAACTTL